MKTATLLRGLGSLLGMALLLGGCGGDDWGDGGAWTKQLGAAGALTESRGVATDASGNVYVAGQTTGGLDGNVQTGIHELVLVKYDAAGTKLYTRQLGAAGASIWVSSVAIDVHGNVYVAGTTNGSLDGNVKTGAYDLVLVKYDAAGTKLYTRQLGAADAGTWVSSVAIDAHGNVYVAGQTNGGLDGNVKAGTYDLFLVKYNAAGTKLYTRQLGAAGVLTEPRGVATDASGNVYVAGQTDGGLDGNPRMGFQDLFLVKYAADGNRLYTRQLGVAAAWTRAFSVATDASGNVYVAGQTTGGLDGNAQTGHSDLVLVKYNAAGTKLYTRQLGAAGTSTAAYGVATDGHGNIYVAGTTNGGLDGNRRMGSQDLFLAKYAADGNRLYTRQLGAAAAWTSASSVATDVNGDVYVAGTTNGSLDGNRRMGSQDLVLVKYDAAGTKQ
ncbi:MAG TPA: SBBP repeat-containing protein [Gammaproteobacteria bacterium]|nr:SBBP repeat-containing protein [Gammaproteobacteria bacterium]